MSNAGLLDGMIMCGWIKIHKKIEEWEWYKDSETKSLFLHLLIKANWKDGRFEGVDVRRGQLITGRKVLSKELGISEQTIRTSLLRLSNSLEISVKSTNKFSIVTMCNYEEYQREDIEANQQLTNNQPTTNQQLTTIEEVKKERSKEVKKETKKPAPQFVCPSLQEVELYFSEKGYPQEAIKFFNYYESNGWKVGKNKMQKWASAASGWISRSASSQKPPTPNRQDKKEQNTDARERLAEEILAKKYGITRTGDGSNKGVVGQIQG